jgi:hypothetical protein
MNTAKNPKRPPLEDGLLTALRAIDNQIRREMQRTPAERETLGTQKWEPYQKRVELLVPLLLSEFGDQTIELDGLVVLSQVLSKTLKLLVEELGSEGLGKLRSAYACWAMEQVSSDAREVIADLSNEQNIV